MVAGADPASAKPWAWPLPDGGGAARCGLASDGVPMAVEQLGVDTFVTTAVGRSFQVFSEQKLRLAFVGPQLPRAITALCTSGERTIVASGTTVLIYRRADLELSLEGEHSARVRHLLVLGETLLTVCEDGEARCAVRRDPEHEVRQLKEPNNLRPRLRIQVAGRLISQKN